jgi:alpha-D-ribose 1-methylphosphonate 5-triphosphate synthase subunit PhnG
MKGGISRVASPAGTDTTPPVDKAVLADTAAPVDAAISADTAAPAMSRKRRTHILVEGDPLVCHTICEQIEEQCQIHLISGPREVLVMNKVRESAQGSLFYLGEALITECKVEMLAPASEKGDRESDRGTYNLSPAANSPVVGIGLILGENRGRAYELAVIDAAFCLPQPLAGHTDWLRLLKREEARLADARKQEWENYAATRVEFSSMLTEDDRREISA